MSLAIKLCLYVLVVAQATLAILSPNEIYILGELTAVYTFPLTFTCFIYDKVSKDRWPSIFQSLFSVFWTFWLIFPDLEDLYRNASKMKGLDFLLSLEPFASPFMIASIFIIGISGFIFVHSIKGPRIQKMKTKSEKQAELEGAERAESGTHGNADLMSQKEAKEVFKAKSGCLLGQTDDGFLLRYDQPIHYFTEANTRSGKGVAIVVPNIFVTTDTLVVLDPKAENFFITARRRLGQGRRVCLFDPLNIVPQIEKRFSKDGVFAACERASVNVLDYVDPSKEDFNALVEQLTETMIDPEVKMNTSDPFWLNAPKGVMNMLVQWVCCAPMEALKKPRTMRTVRDYAFMSGTELLDQMEFWSKQDHLAQGALARHGRMLLDFKNNMRGYASVMKIAQTWLTFMDVEGVTKTISGEIGEKFSLSDLVEGETDFYVVFPIEMLDAQPQAARVIITSLIQTLLRSHGGTKNRVLFMLDELQRLKNMPIIHSALGALGGMGGSIWGIVQTMKGFIKDWGEKEASAFINGCHVHVYFGLAKDSVKEVADQLGETTFVDRSTSEGGGGSHQADKFSWTTSTNTGESIKHVKRHLITPHTLRTMSRDELIIVVGDENPLRAKRVKYYEHRMFKGDFDLNPYIIDEGQKE